MIDSTLTESSDLRRRGWTGRLIRRFAGLPEDLTVNPHYPLAGAPIKLYRSERIGEIGASAEFKGAASATVEGRGGMKSLK